MIDKNVSQHKAFSYRMKIIKFYAEQSRIADLRKLRAEWRMKRMKLNEKRNRFLLLQVSNDAEDQNIVNNTPVLCSVNDSVHENKHMNPTNDNYAFTLENEKNNTNRRYVLKKTDCNIDNKEEKPENIIKHEPHDKLQLLQQPPIEKQLTAAQRNKLKVC